MAEVELFRVNSPWRTRVPPCPPLRGTTADRQYRYHRSDPLLVLVGEQMALRPSVAGPKGSSSTANPVVLDSFPPSNVVPRRPCRQLDPTPQTPSAFARPQ